MLAKCSTSLSNKTLNFISILISLLIIFLFSTAKDMTKHFLDCDFFNIILSYIKSVEYKKNVNDSA